MQKKRLIILGVILAVVLAAGLMLHLKNKADSTTTTEGSATSEEAEQGAIIIGDSNYTIELDDGMGRIEELAPSLERAIVFGESVPADVRALFQTKIDAVRDRLKGDLSRADDWMMLGVLYHSSNDYIGARDVWEFLLQVLKTEETAVVHENLGKLYKFDLKDFPKSESYFKAALQAAPNSLSPYIELFELYRYLYKIETTAAVDIMREAMRKFPNEIDPHTLLASYYREKKEYAKARAEYTKALDMARERGDSQLVALIGNDLASLPE